VGSWDRTAARGRWDAGGTEDAAVVDTAATGAGTVCAGVAASWGSGVEEEETAAEAAVGDGELLFA